MDGRKNGGMDEYIRGKREKREREVTFTFSAVRVSCEPPNPQPSRPTALCGRPSPRDDLLSCLLSVMSHPATPFGPHRMTLVTETSWETF